MKKYFFTFAVLGLFNLQSFSQGVVVNSNPTMNDRFSKKAGSLRLSSTVM